MAKIDFRNLNQTAQDSALLAKVFAKRGDVVIGKAEGDSYTFKPINLHRFLTESGNEGWLQVICFPETEAERNSRITWLDAAERAEYERLTRVNII